MQIQTWDFFLRIESIYIKDVHTNWVLISMTFFPRYNVQNVEVSNFLTIIYMWGTQSVNTYNSYSFPARHAFFADCKHMYHRCVFSLGFISVNINNQRAFIFSSNFRLLPPRTGRLACVRGTPANIMLHVLRKSWQFLLYQWYHPPVLILVDLWHRNKFMIPK